MNSSNGNVIHTEGLSKAYKGVRPSIDFQNPDGSLYVEPGILNAQERMRDGRLFVFEGANQAWLNEKRKYHRKENTVGRVSIVKKDDHVLDLCCGQGRHARSESRGVTA